MIKHNREVQKWSQLDERYMTEESESDGDDVRTHKLQ